MGIQVTFFMTESDEQRFLEAIGQISPYQLLKNTFADKADYSIPNLSVENNIRILYICRNDIVSRIKFDYTPEENIYSIDFQTSEVVQFRRCRMNDHILLVGRLWFDGNSNRGKKRKLFVDWANQLLAWIRRNFQLDKDDYVGPDALAKSKLKEIQLGPNLSPDLWNKFPGKL